MDLSRKLQEWKIPGFSGEAPNTPYWLLLQVQTMDKVAQRWFGARPKIKGCIQLTNRLESYRRFDSKKTDSRVSAVTERTDDDQSIFNTMRMHGVIGRMRQEPEVRNDLFRLVQGRLNRLARRMLRDFPRLAALTEADDILQNASIRLLRALETLTPATTREFFQLVTVHLRRELIDLSRKHFGPLGQGSNEVLVSATEGSRSAYSPIEFSRETGTQELEHWAEFHEKIGELPAQEREVFSLTYYHGMTQNEIGEVFGLDERTIRRHWKSAVERLKTILSAECLAKLG